MDYKESTRNAYNLDSEKYIKKYKKHSNFEKRKEFNEFMKHLKGKKIIDIGCGPGFHTQFFNENGLECTGIDNSEEMVKYGNKKEILALTKEKFDLIWYLEQKVNGMNNLGFLSRKL